MLRPVVSIACLFSAAFLVACSGGDSNNGSKGASGSGGSGASNQGSGGSAASAGGGGGGTPWDPGGKVTTYTAKFPDVKVAPGGQDVQCIIFHLDNPEPVNVRRFHTTLTQGSHHMILYKAIETTENLTPTDCQSLGGFDTGDHPVFIAQQLSSELELPTDTDANRPVALKLDAHQMVKLELHYFNTSNDTITVNGEIEVDSIPNAASVTESDLAFWGTQDINIPPHGQFDTGVHFQYGLQNTNTFAVTTHQHQLGTEMRVWFGTGPDAAKQAPIDTSFTWSNPPLVLLDPPIHFGGGPAGGLSSDGFAYDCHWVNPTANEVKFGETVEDEMCFLWHYYYPSQGFQVCFDGLCSFTK